MAVVDVRGLAAGDATKLTVYVGRGAHAGVIERCTATASLARQMVIAVGDAEPIAAALAEIDEPLRTLERVRICKRDELTAETGLVTSEQVLRATGPQIARGGLRLAEPGVR